ncbi:MAG TPA: MFS transporter [Patescibacteria group bacterium]|nr:MFS transporter [Patescibacteria group bacterium]
MTTAQQPSKYSFGVLKIKNFRALLFTRMFIMMALQAQAVIVGWQIYSITKDTFLLGLTGLAEAIPAITCALFAGHVVDVGKPLRIYRIAIFALACNTLLLFTFAGGHVEVDHKYLLYIIYGGIFLSGLARAFVIPASFTMLSLCVKREEMPAAAAWISTGFQFSSIASPAIAGLIYGGYGSAVAWGMPALLMAAAFIMVHALKVTSHPRGEIRESAVKSIKAGWKFIWEKKTLLNVMALDMFAVLFGGAVAMLPAIAEDVLHVGSEGLGLLRAAPAAGAVFTTLLLAVRPMRHVSSMRLLIVVAGFGLCMCGFGLSTSFPLSLLFLMISGVCDSISVVIRQTLMQLLTPDAMRGRVSSISSMFIISSNEIGAFESGTAARLMGLQPSIVFGGVCTLGVVALISLFNPAMRKTVVDVRDPK